MQQPVPAGAMFLEVGRIRYEVASLKHASEMFCKARDASGQGASQIPAPLIVRESGEIIGYVAYNGRVFPGTPQQWQPGVQPLYENRE